MNFIEIIAEGRVEDFKNKFAQKFGDDLVNKIINSVPHKYLNWVGKTLNPNEVKEKFEKMVSGINQFQNISTNLPITDLYQYKSIDQLLSAINEYETKRRRNFKNVAGGNIVYDDGRFLVVNPLNHDSSCYYGKGTKWCTAAQDDPHFQRYNEDGKLFYILDKTLSTKDPLYKVALLYKFDGDKSYWNAEDITVKTGWIYGTKTLDNILKSVVDYINTAFPEQVKIFSDREAAKKQREKNERERQQRILMQKKEAAEERRLDNEWELGPDCPDEGLKANALFKYLVNSEGVEPLTDEDRNKISELETKLEELNNEYDANGDQDLLQQMFEIDDELDGLKLKMDVYSIIPDGEYYDTNRFEIIDVLGIEGREYAVGTESEMESSAYEYVEQLLDDIGYEGFTKSFVVDYIDDEEVVSYADEFFSYDVRESPDSYLDDDDKTLSDYQLEEIDVLKRKISQANGLIGRLRNDEDEEDVEDRINDLEESISEMEEEIRDIESSPDGDYSEDAIEREIENRLSYVKRDPMSFIDDWGLDYKNFIDKRKFIEGVVEADGYGHTLNSYDGSSDEVELLGKQYFIMRLN